MPIFVSFFAACVNLIGALHNSVALHLLMIIALSDGSAGENTRGFFPYLFLERMPLHIPHFFTNFFFSVSKPPLKYMAVPAHGRTQCLFQLRVFCPLSPISAQNEAVLSSNMLFAGNSVSFLIFLLVRALLLLFLLLKTANYAERKIVKHGDTPIRLGDTRIRTIIHSMVPSPFSDFFRLRSVVFHTKVPLYPPLGTLAAASPPPPLPGFGRRPV